MGKGNVWGTLLTPLLLLIFVDDLPEVVTSTECVMYHDNVKLY